MNAEKSIAKLVECYAIILSETSNQGPFLKDAG